MQEAARIAQPKKSLEGENRSTSIKAANTKVPEINPNCTEESISPVNPGLRLWYSAKSPTMAFPATHKEVQANWEKIITGRIWVLFFKVKALHNR